jgi:hypothetical protein
MKMPPDHQRALGVIASAGSHGHHGQVPRGEYLMALSAHIEGPTGAPVFLTSDEFSRLCLEFGLPVNDTWLVAGKHFAQKARELLDDMSTQVRHEACDDDQDIVHAVIITGLMLVLLSW